MTDKEKCKKILAVFHDYIQQKKEIDIFWSEKHQCWYYIQQISPEDQFCLNNIAYEAFLTPEWLCHELLLNLSCEVFGDFGLYDIPGQVDLTPEALKEFQKRAQTYLEQIPEYFYLLNEIRS